MRAIEPNGDEPSNIFVMARAITRSGRCKVSRKERLQLGLVELRDRIYREFGKVAKAWDVSAQELRRDYSLAYPVPALGEPDALCLEKACDNVIVMLHCDMAREAEQYGVPSDILEVVLVDWLLADLTGRKRTPPAAFIRTAEDAYNGLMEDRLPTAWKATDFLFKRRSKTAGNGTKYAAGPSLELKSEPEPASEEARAELDRPSLDSR